MTNPQAMNRRRYSINRVHIVGALLAAVLACALTTASAAPRPNLILILADDLGYGDVSTYGRQDVRTPQLDRLAAEGMLFTNMRANCSVCSPTRAALLTGRYADRVGVPGVIRGPRDTFQGSMGYFDPTVATLADELKKAGYHTALVGKWHLGLESPNTPNERGFDFFQGTLHGNFDSYTTHLHRGINWLRRNTEVIQPTGHLTDLFTDWAVAYLRERARRPEQPFFLYLAHFAPHDPIQPPEEWLARVKQRDPQLPAQRAAYVALVEHLDHGLGRVLETLRETGLERNTLVFFTSDNGGALNHGANNAPWRGGKTDLYDGGLRVPFVARWPGHIPAGSRSDYAGLIFDVFPTALELAGRPLAPDLDAVSLLPVLRGGNLAGPRDLYFVRREGGRAAGKSHEALIRGEWKLVQNDPFRPLELFNLKTDPAERNDLATDPAHRKLFNELLAALQQHIQRGGATPWQPPSTRTLNSVGQQSK